MVTQEYDGYPCLCFIVPLYDTYLTEMEKLPATTASPNEMLRGIQDVLLAKREETRRKDEMLRGKRDARTWLALAITDEEVAQPTSFCQLLLSTRP